MRVDLLNSAGISQLEQKRDNDRQVQDVFSSLLAQAGRKGYASAEPIDQSEPIAQNIQSSWETWFTGELGGRYAEAKNPEELKQSFGQILLKAHQEGGYIDPKEFLNQLSSEELGVIQNVHWLADEINVSSLTEEGALNLLLPPATQIDLNEDGFTRTGVSYGLKFPNSNTPASVVSAWEEATAGMDFFERATAELQMMMPLMMANIVLDENGEFLYQREPGDPDFVNPMANSNYSYKEAAQSLLDHLEFVKNELAPEKYEKQKSFWSNFKQLLEEQSAR